MRGYAPYVIQVECDHHIPNAMLFIPIRLITTLLVTSMLGLASATQSLLVRIESCSPYPLCAMYLVVQRNSWLRITCL